MKLGFGKNEKGKALGIVYSDQDEQLGAFILDKKDPEQVAKALALGVNMDFACYTYEYYLRLKN